MRDEVARGVLQEAIEHYENQLVVDKYYNDPAGFAKDVLGIHLWSLQKEIADNILKTKRTAVKAGHGVGKSYLAAILAIWWIATRIKHGADKVLVVTTAPTYAQVHGVVWEHIRNFIGVAAQRYKEGLTKVRIPGYVTNSDEWKTADGVQIGFGRKPADGTDSAFQGFHKMYTLVILDEATGIRRELWDQVEAITTQPTCRLLSIGNPTDPSSFFAELFYDDKGWDNKTISVLDSPNYTRQYLTMPDHPMYKRAKMDEHMPMEALAGLTGTDWLVDMIKLHGENSPYLVSRAYADFPETTLNTLFSQADIARGHDTHVQPDPHGKGSVFGVDVSRFGDDYSTIYKYSPGFLNMVDKHGKNTGKRRADAKRGGKLEFIDKKGKSDTVETAHWIHNLALEHNVEEVRVDGVGVGAGVVDQLAYLSDGQYLVADMVGNAQSPDAARWRNARAFWFDELRRLVHNGELDLCREEMLESELLTIQYHFKNRESSLQIESKEEMRARGVKSPDHADAAAYAVADLSRVRQDPLSTMQIGDRIEIDLDALAYQMDFTIGPY